MTEEMTDKARELARELSPCDWLRSNGNRTCIELGMIEQGGPVCDGCRQAQAIERAITDTERRCRAEFSKIENTPQSVLAAKENIDIAHIKAGVSDGCVCDLCQACRAEADALVAALNEEWKAAIKFPACTHDEENWYCDSCRLVWEIAIDWQRAKPLDAQATLDKLIADKVREAVEQAAQRFIIFAETHSVTSTRDSIEQVAAAIQGRG